MTPAIFVFHPVFAASCAANNFFFFLPPWYKYLALANKLDQTTCTIVSPPFVFPNDVWLIGLAILDMLLRLAGFVAVISIIISGIMYVTSAGEPDKAAAARKRLSNSLIGLVIALIATGFVAFIANTLIK
jgi:hypothetical protein